MKPCDGIRYYPGCAEYEVEGTAWPSVVLVASSVLYPASLHLLSKYSRGPAMRFGVLSPGSCKLLVFKTESRSSRASYVSGYELVVQTNFLQVENLIARREGTRTLMISILAALFASASLVAVGSYSDDGVQDSSTSEIEANQVYARASSVAAFFIFKRGLG